MIIDHISTQTQSYDYKIKNDDTNVYGEKLLFN